MRAIETGGSLGHDAIDDLAGEFRPRRLGKHPLAHLRIDAIRPDHEGVVLAMAVGQFDLDATGHLGQRLDRGTETHVRTGRQSAGREDAVQLRPHDAARAGQIRGDRREMQLFDQLPVLGENVGAFPGGAVLLHLIEHAQDLQRPQRRTGNRDPRAVDLPGGINFDQVDRNPRAAQRDRAGHPADAAADNEHLVAASQIASPAGSLRSGIFS